MNSVERRAIFSLAGIFGLRMFGLFALLPVLAIYASELKGVTPALVGLTLGIYGLTQAIFQIPFGLLSDRFGRKRIILIGLVIFALGSLIAASATNITWLLIGRAVQGAGAISAAVLALSADLTREDQRTKAMAVIGMSIGLVFLLSMALAPPLVARIGISGLFVVTAILSIVAITVLLWIVPTPQTHVLHRDVLPVGSQLAGILREPQLLQLNIGIFALHLILTALFVVVPLQLLVGTGLEGAQHWQIYLPVIIASVIGMIPLVLLSSRKGRTFLAFRISIGVLLSGLILLFVGSGSEYSTTIVIISLWTFFVGFNALEAMLPSLVSQVAPAAAKGSAMGIYSTFQFAGMFVGGILAGIINQRFGAPGVYLICVVVGFSWLILALFSRGFTLYSTKVLDIGSFTTMQTDALIDRIRQVRGVQEVTIVQGESLAYLKVDDKELDTTALYQLKQT